MVLIVTGTVGGTQSEYEDVLECACASSHAIKVERKQRTRDWVSDPTLEVIEYLKADWQGLADVQLATLNWLDWFNKKRVHSTLGYVSPFDFEAMYYDKINPLGQVA